MDRMTWSGWMLVAMLWPLALHASRAGSTGHAQSLRESPWSLAPDPALPEPDTTIPESAAGCVVVGYVVDALGRVHNPQILQGAYTATVDGAMQRGYEASVIRVAGGWRHVPNASPSATPAYKPVFMTQTIGFLPVVGKGDIRVVSGADRQFPALSEPCAVANLAEWGEANAVPVSEALARGEGGVVVQGRDEMRRGWISRDLLQGAQYPREALRRGDTACLVMAFLVQSDGTPTAIREVSSHFGNSPPKSNRKAFAQHAAAAIAGWRYSPAPDNLQRTPFLMQASVTFTTGSRGGDLECHELTSAELVEAIQAAAGTGG